MWGKDHDSYYSGGKNRACGHDFIDQVSFGSLLINYRQIMLAQIITMGSGKTHKIMPRLSASIA